MLTHPTSLQGPKSVLHVQNCCFANLTLLLFWPSCCHCILTSEATTECVVTELTIYVGRITYIFKDKHVVLLFEHDTGKVLLKNKKFRSRLRINSSRYSLLYLHSLDGHDDLSTSSHDVKILIHIKLPVCAHLTKILTCEI